MGGRGGSSGGTSAGSKSGRSRFGAASTGIDRPNRTISESEIIKAAKKLESTFESGALISITKLVESLRGQYTKHAIKSRLFAMAKTGKYSLHFHDFPQKESRKIRSRLIRRYTPGRDSGSYSDYTFYIGFNKR